MIDLNTNFWAAVAGAIVGGAISVVLQMSANRAARQQRDDERRNEDAALAHAVVFKLMKVHSNMHNLHGYIEEAFKRAGDDGFKGQPWQIVRPSANFPDLVRFEPAEMSMVLLRGGADLTNLILDLEEVHRRCIEVFKMISTERRSLTEMLPSRMDGERGEAIIDEELMLRVGPKMSDVNSLIGQFQSMSAVDRELSSNALKEAQKALRKTLKLTFKVSITA